MFLGSMRRSWVGLAFDVRWHGHRYVHGAPDGGFVALGLGSLLPTVYIHVGHRWHGLAHGVTAQPRHSADVHRGKPVGRLSERLSDVGVR